MTDALQPTQRGATITYEGKADEELQVWMEDITLTVNALEETNIADNTLIINGLEVSELDLIGRSTTYSILDNKGTFTHFENFSYSTVPADEEVTIPANQQMIVSGTQNVLGTLDIEGSMVLI